MILADVRHQLTRDDAQVALRLVGRDSPDAYADAEAALRDAGIDALLDDPRLLSSLLDTRPSARAASHPAMHVSDALFLYVVVRHALLAVNMSDRVLADYVSSLLVHFGRRGRAWRLADTDDETYDTLAAIVADAEVADARRAFLARVHLGNYALWLSGLFPDNIAYRRARRGGPDLEYYDTLGRRGFELAAAHRLAAEYGVVQLFAAVAQHFERVRSALNTVSDTLLFPHSTSPDRILRQVSNTVRWGTTPSS
jgi:hypothetical protein